MDELKPATKQAIYVYALTEWKWPKSQGQAMKSRFLTWRPIKQQLFVLLSVFLSVFFLGVFVLGYLGVFGRYLCSMLYRLRCTSWKPFMTYVSFHLQSALYAEIKVVVVFVSLRLKNCSKWIGFSEVVEGPGGLKRSRRLAGTISI